MDEAPLSVTEFCNQVITQVTELRFVASTVGPHSAPTQVMEEIFEARARLERIEELILQVYQLKEKLHRSLTANKAAYTDAWNNESTKINNNSRSRMNDYASSKERIADIEINILPLKRAERESERLYSHANEAFEYTKMCQRGIESYKKDLELVIRLYQIETSLGGRR